MKTISLIGLLAALISPAMAWADTDSSATSTTDDSGQHSWGFGVHANTLGLGGEVNFVVNPYLVVRADYNYYNDYSFTTTKDNIHYDAHLRLNNYGAALDWHPMAGKFLISLGLFKDNNFIDATAVPQQSYVINGQTFTAAEIGTLNGHITFNSWAPYLGVGFNSLGSEEKGVGVEVSAGVFYQGSPSVALNPSGSITSVPGLGQATQAEQQKLDDQWNSYKYYPVVNLGLVFRF